jgi:hypothetical protein
MSEQGIFITVKDLMVLHGSNSYEAMRRQHKAVRDALTSKTKKDAGKIKPYLTIKEYVRYMDMNLEEVCAFLKRTISADPS